MATTTSACMPPLNLKKWVEDHAEDFKPPVGNKYLYRGNDFFVMVIGGPNARNDFHQTLSEEYFYQVKGDILVKIREEDGSITNHVVREGETFFIPSNVPHSPCRPADTIGVVVERNRPPGELERQIYYCDNCNATVYDEAFDLKDIVEHFKQHMLDFWANDEARTCGNCGTKVEKPGPFVMPADL